MYLAPYVNNVSRATRIYNTHKTARTPVISRPSTFYPEEN